VRAESQPKRGVGDFVLRREAMETGGVWARRRVRSSTMMGFWEGAMPERR
jgi:hypothetical protein